MRVLMSILAAVLAATFLVPPPAASAQGVQAAFYLSPPPGRFYASASENNFNEPRRAVRTYVSSSGEWLHLVAHIWSSPAAAHQRYLEVDADDRNYNLVMSPIPHGGYADEGGSVGAGPYSAGSRYTLNYRVGSVLLFAAYTEPHAVNGSDVLAVWQDMIQRARLAPYR